MTSATKRSEARPKPAEPLRVIVETARPRGEDPAVAMRTFGFAIDPAAFQLDGSFDPVAVEFTPNRPLAMNLEEAGTEAVLLRGTIGSRQEMDALAKRPGILGIWDDTPIAASQTGEDTVFGEPAATAAMGPCPIPPCDCTPVTPKGTLADVAKYLGADQIWATGIKGQGIVVGVVDGGITTPSRVPGGKIDGVIGGNRPDWGTLALWGRNGEKCATDVLGIAPEAKLYDLRLPGHGGVARLSDAIASFAWAISRHKADGTPQVLSNSWALYRKSYDEKYATDPNHPLNRIVADAVNEGIHVLFETGPCGATCPSSNCGGDVGPGKSIWGANGHPLVMTVGAANIKEQLAGYSGQGPAALDPYKPDFCSITHFKGYFSSDNGTSTACSVAAGVVALLKQCKKPLTPAAAKAVLKATAKNIGPAGWDPHSGSGIIQAKAAFNTICGVVQPCRRERDLVIRYRDAYRKTRDRRYLCGYYYWLARYYCCLYRVRRDRRLLCRCYYYLGRHYCCRYQLTRNRRYLCACYRYLAKAYCCLHRITQNQRYLDLCRRYQAAFRRYCR